MRPPFLESIDARIGIFSPFRRMTGLAAEARYRSNSMSEKENIRRERIERLLRELEYEITRGMMEREIEPEMGWSKIMPGGPTGTVIAEFRVRPRRDGEMFFDDWQAPRLRVVADGPPERTDR